MINDEIFALIADERKRQIEKWGIQRHAPGKWTMTLIEEVGEACEAFLEQRELDGVQELIQAAAVIMAWIEALMVDEQEMPEVRK